MTTTNIILPNNLQNSSKNISSINPYSFKTIFKKINAHNKYRFSNNNNNKNLWKFPPMESNFTSVPKEENYFTKDIPYIKNKKMQIFDKFEYDNGTYIPDRINKYDMKNLAPIKKKNTMLYKTTTFRNNKLTNEKKLEIDVNVYEKLIKNFERKHKDYKKQNYTIYVDDTFKKEKPYHAGNSLYKELNIKKNQLYDKYFEKKKENNNNSNKTNSLDDKKNKTNQNFVGYEYLLTKKPVNEVPQIFQKSMISGLIYNNYSEKERYENLIDKFNKLKYLIQTGKNKFKELDYIKDFLNRNKILDYNEEKLKNFSNFLNMKKIPINIEKTLKENIIYALNFNKEKYLKEHKITKNNSSSILNNKKYFINDSNNNTIQEEEDFLKGSLMKSMERQKKLYLENNQNIINNKNYIQIANDLDTEINNIYDENEKNKKLFEFQNEFYITHQYGFCNNNLNKNLTSTNLNKIDLRLGNSKEFKELEKNNENNNNKNKKNKFNLTNFNNRLYYNWEKKHKNKLTEIEKNNKLTELIVLERIKRKIILDKVKNNIDYDEINYKNYYS